MPQLTSYAPCGGIFETDHALEGLCNCREGLGGSRRPVLILMLLACRHKMATPMSKQKKWKLSVKIF